MDAETTALLQKVLKDHGYSMTASRRYVCELLWQKEPQSMRELAKQAEGHVDRASLYRTIGLYEKLGLVQRIYIGWKYKVELSDVLSHHHHHINCLGCGKLVAIKDENQVEHFIGQLADKHGFKPESHQLEIRGYCSSCR